MTADHHLPRRIVIGHGKDIITACLTDQIGHGIKLKPKNGSHGPLARWYGGLHGLTAQTEQFCRLANVKDTDSSGSAVLTQRMPSDQAGL